MSLPTSRDELRQRWQNGERFTFLFFYGHKPPPSGVDESCFSQWFARPFFIDDIQYDTAEHWMMAEKARLFEDDAMLESILHSTSPREAKSFGRKVQNFDANVWDQHKFDIVVRGNLAKFSQHDDLRDYLLATVAYSDASRSGAELLREKPASYDLPKSSSVVLVEAAGRDVIWGIGLGKNNPKAQNPMTWRGKNLLGFALTVVRERLSVIG